MLPRFVYVCLVVACKKTIYIYDNQEEPSAQSGGSTDQQRAETKEQKDNIVRNASFACHVHQVSHPDGCRDENAEQSRCSETGSKCVDSVCERTH